MVCSNKDFMKRVSQFQAGKVVGIEYLWDKIFDLRTIREQNICFNEEWDRYEDWVFVMDYLKCLSTEQDNILISPICVYEYQICQNSTSHTYDPRLFEKNRRCFQHIKRNLEYYGLFEGEIVEGYYHGYVNKMIGQVIAYRNNSVHGGFEEYLVGDDDFLEGLRRYKIRNAYETTEILNILKEKFL